MCRKPSVLRAGCRISRPSTAAAVKVSTSSVRATLEGMRGDSSVNTLDESEFEDAVRWLHEQYRQDLAVLRTWPPSQHRPDASGSGPWAVRTVASQAAQLDVTVDSVRRALSADLEVHPALVAELNRLLARYRTRRGFRRGREPEN